MSAHTQNLLADPRASLCVTEAAFRGAADARVTLVGSVHKVRRRPAGLHPARATQRAAHSRHRTSCARRSA